jgi:hypothetical protein
MQGRCPPATLEVTGSNPGPGKINLIKIEKTINRIYNIKISRFNNLFLDFCHKIQPAFASFCHVFCDGNYRLNVWVYNI